MSADACCTICASESQENQFAYILTSSRLGASNIAVHSRGDLELKRKLWLWYR